MKKANDTGEVTSLITAHMKKGVATNNFLSVSDYENALMKENLFYEDFQSGIFVLRRKDDFYKLNFHLNAFDSFPEINGAVTVCEVAGKGSVDERVEKYLLKNGFSVYKERVRLIRKREPIYSVSGEGAEFCEKKDLKRAFSLIKDNFDKYSGCIPDEDEFEKDIAEKKVICFRTEDKISGILHFARGGKSAEIRHLAVSPESRGKGAAANMIKFYSDNSPCEKFSVWTGADNLIAIKLYNDNGYEKDGMISKVYIAK